MYYVVEMYTDILLLDLPAALCDYITLCSTFLLSLTVGYSPATVSKAFLLQWTPPAQFDGDSLLQYEVTLTPLGVGPAAQLRYILPAAQSQLTAQGLQTGEEYQVEIDTRVDSGLLQPFYLMNITIPTTSNPPPPTCPPATIAIASGWIVAGILLICLVVAFVVALICWRRSGRFVFVWLSLCNCMHCLQLIKSQTHTSNEYVHTLVFSNDFG